ncbi:MAG: protein kinase [Ignavibacteria bacterium]|nr:protein kinase [Ignavibacteria bacterium]
MIDKVISHYKILEKLGEGGMGVVYKAEDIKLKREVAIKFLPDYISSNQEERKRFEIEAQAAASLNHPNICTIYSIEEADDQTFIVMEYIEGKELKDIVETNRDMSLPINDVLKYAVQIAEGLEAAHKKGIVHRDIKSSNIMISEDGKVKIMDFGLAKLFNSQVTKSNQTLGTLSYISPEQLQGLKVDFRADFWSFGVVLYEMLTGTLPFQGDYEATVIYAILNEDPKAIQNYRSDVPENIISLVSSMLQKDPDKRISSMNELMEKLKTKISTQEIKANGEKSVAVLYFENMSPEKENEYFCAGITEDLITDLSRIKELRVIPRSDVLPFRNKEINSKKVGEMLKVPFILEGSVRKAGQKIRISAQLVDVKSGFPVWADRYDRSLEDIFEIQMEVSQKITGALKLSLTETEKKLIGKKPTVDMRAYDFYLRGRDFLSKYGKRNNEAAIQMFEFALSIDADFALAYAGLAEAYSYKYMWYDGNLKWLGKIIDVSEKALEKDPGLTEAKFGIGMVYYHQKRFNEAIDIFKKIIEEKNDFYLAYRWLGITSDILGDYDSAIKYYKASATFKPYSEEPLMQLDMTYRRKGDFESAKKVEKEFLKIAEQKLLINPDDVIALSRVAGVYSSQGDKEKALQTIKRVMEIDPEDGLAIYNSACVYARMNMKDEALKYLRIAFDNGYKNIREWVKSDPDFNTLRDDPEFKKIIDVEV